MLYASKKVIEHSDSLASDLAKEILNRIYDNVDIMAPENLKADIDYLRVCIDEGFNRESAGYIKPEIINFGSDIRNGKEFQKQGIVVDIEKILNLIRENDELDSILASQNYEISLAMYHDEILLVNPIGNFKNNPGLWTGLQLVLHAPLTFKIVVSF